MAKVLLDILELSDIKKVVEQVIKERLKDLSPKEKIPIILLTRIDAAKFLRISLPTLNDWTKNGIIKGYRIGNRVLYKSHEIEEALEKITSSKAGRK